jgi:hypothetical protein
MTKNSHIVVQVLIMFVCLVKERRWLLYHCALPEEKGPVYMHLWFLVKLYSTL